MWQCLQPVTISLETSQALKSAQHQHFSHTFTELETKMRSKQSNGEHGIHYVSYLQ